jgi:nitroreductase
MKKVYVALILSLMAAGVFAQDITLGKAPAKLGVDILDAIRLRTAARAFVKAEVPPADLSTILWAGNGLKGGTDAVSAASKAGATIPVSGDLDYVNLYVLNSKGVYRYMPENNVLKQVNTKDQRGAVTQENIATSAFMVLFTYDSTKLPSFAKGNATFALELALGAASYSGQNIALVAAGLKLSSIVMFNISPPAVATAAKLAKDEMPLFIMQLGYTK